MKHALVTGSTRGIGKAIGLKLMENGFHVIFNYNQSETSANHLKKVLESSAQTNYSLIKADLSLPDIADSFCNNILSITNKLDVIVFNTGITDRSEWTKIKPENWHAVMNTNLNNPVLILQKLYPNLNLNSNIVFIGSLLGEIPHATSLSYGVSKAAIHSLTQNLVKFLKEKQIRVNCIAPGFIDSDWQKEKPKWLREKIENKIALNRFGKVEEVAELAWHIIQNDYLNGQVIKIDGGYNYE
ncbi:MAG: SDR family oxidoreductase [Prolixibacteraceae bacterium]|nr:SDR family oxidoreductase [Prolixibacteraceae bacterium]